MADNSTNTGLALRSLINKSGEFELSLKRLAIGEPAADEVVVRVEASPINPSDVGLLLGPADRSTFAVSGSGDNVLVRGRVPAPMMPGIAARIDQSMPVGNEGAGVVVKAGASAEAQALVGKTVAMFGGAMYAQYRTIKAQDCLALPSGTTAIEGASCFVNPLTALGMTETMRREGHKALVHTAAASNLGQMLNRICLKDGIGLVNIVRNAEQTRILREIGARHVCDSSAPTFTEDLTQALVETGATLGFDAIGGKLTGQILLCMEAAIGRAATSYSRYGSSVHKQVYIYGSLDPGPIELVRGFGMAWGVGGWLLTSFLTSLAPADAQRLRQRVTAELKTTFASHYTKVISLHEALQLPTIAAYAKRATGQKYLIDPHKAG